MNKKGVLIVDGIIYHRSEEIFLQPTEILTIYVDTLARKLLWAFEKGVMKECPIPDSIFDNGAEMLFFIGLNNTTELI